jgi:hypothetical protein
MPNGNMYRVEVITRIESRDKENTSQQKENNRSFGPNKLAYSSFDSGWIKDNNDLKDNGNLL